MHPFDDLDKNLLTALSKDSSESIPLLAKKLGTKQSVLYGRIKRLRSAGVIEKFTCRTLGIKVEGKTPAEATAEINEGKWDQAFT